MQDDQPEYINIDAIKPLSQQQQQLNSSDSSSLKHSDSWSSANAAVLDNSWSSPAAAAATSDWLDMTPGKENTEYPNTTTLPAPSEEWLAKTKMTHAIGPDDWYRDDFNFNKSHPFMEDPVLLKQYAQILDMKYRDGISNERVEELLKNTQLQPNFKLDQYEEGQVSRSLIEAVGQRYPDSGYDTLRMNMTERSNVCVDIETEPVVLREGGKVKEERRRAQTWHTGNFQDFQLMEKEDSTVFLSIEGQEHLAHSEKRSPREDKMTWSPSKSYKDIRREKEAPPKNVVKERLRSFEHTKEAEDVVDVNETTKRDLKRKDSKNRVRSKSVNYSTDDSDFEHSEEKKLEKKKSVKDLLSDFEKKSKELQEKEEGYRGIGSFLLKDSKETDRRRVFSDTETLMYETSSDEENSDEIPLSAQIGSRGEEQIDKSVEKTEKDNECEITSGLSPPPLPPKKPPPTLLDEEGATLPIKEPFKIHPDALQAEEQKPIVTEETYLAMTPSKSLSSLTGSSPSRKPGLSLLSSTHTSRTSLSSSHGSSQSITSAGLPRFGSDKNLGSMTPTEALIQSATAGSIITHSRTPSQTLVMEHLQQEVVQVQHFEEETYVDMNEDGSFVRTPRAVSHKEPILSGRHIRKENNLDTTLTGESPESPRYCEIEENAHYEYLYKARTPQAQHYEVLYQEIEENADQGAATGTIKEKKRNLSKKNDPEPLKPIEGLPDILGNAPTNKGNSSSDADDESSKDFDIDLKKTQKIITMDDSFRPASFYLSHSKPIHGGTNNDGDSSDSDLVSPPPVPSSPPPMEEVLGYPTSATNLDLAMPPVNLSTILSAAKARQRRDSQEETSRRPSVSSKASHGSANLAGSIQSLNRDQTMSPHRLHGSHQSLSSRELPPIPGQSQLGSQQSLASKEIQLIGSRSEEPSENNVISPHHSREGSLDNEMFLYHRFTQGSSLSDPYRKQSSDEFSSDTALYEQEYRRYHLENIQEVSNTLERMDSGSLNTSIISQDLNISYNSVYDSRLQQSKVYKLEDHPALKKRKSLDERQGHEQSNTETDEGELSPRSKIPYYVSDIMEEGQQAGGAEMAQAASGDQVVDAITKSMNALDMESSNYFKSKNEVENERIRKLRRSYTPDPYQTKVDPNKSSDEALTHVSRSKSLEGLLGDSQGSARDNMGYPNQPKVYSPHNFNDISSMPRPARGHQPPPPPEGVPPLDIRPLSSNKDSSVDDADWADTLRKASLKQQRVKSPESKQQLKEENGHVSEVQSIIREGMSQAQLGGYGNRQHPQYRSTDDRGRQSVPTVLNDGLPNNMPAVRNFDGRHSVPPHVEANEHHVRRSSYIEQEQNQALHYSQNQSMNEIKNPYKVDQLDHIDQPSQYQHDSRYHVQQQQQYVQYNGGPQPGLQRRHGRQSVPAHVEFRGTVDQQQLSPREDPRNLDRRYMPSIRDERAKLPPPTAPKPKTPVHFAKEHSAVNMVQQEPVKRNATVYNQADHQYLRHSLASLDKSISSTDMHNTSAASTSRHFLEAGLPSPTSNEAGPSGRQNRSATLPARIRYSDASSSRLSSLEPDLESPRTSKSGIQDPGSPVPPSPRDSLTVAGYTAQQGRISGPSSPRESITDGQFLPAGQERRTSIPSSPRSSSVGPPVAVSGQQHQDSPTRSTQGPYYSAAKPSTQQTNLQQPRFSQEPDDSVYQNEYFHNSHLHQNSPSSLPSRQNAQLMQQQMYQQQNAQISMANQNTMNQYQNAMPPHHNPMTQNQNHMVQHHNPMAQHHNPMVQHHNPIAQHHNPMAQHQNPMAQQQNPMAQHQNPMAQHQNPMAKHQNMMPPGHQNNVNQHQNNVNQHQNLMSQHQEQTGQHQIHLPQQQQHQSLLQGQPERQTAEGQQKC